MCLVNRLLANDITITNVHASEKSSPNQWLNISFDLSISSSWRINAGVSNWNAGWIFLKYKVGANGEWHHATISTIDNEHFAPANTTIDASADGKGIFIYDSRENAGSDFTFNRTDIKLRWNYGLDGIADNESELYFKVYGIEMVYIPEGEFYLGSGGTEEDHFHTGGSVVTPFEVVDGGQILVRNIPGALYYGGNDDRDGPIFSTFPNGYNAFYVMRYEISQEQYKDFLNSLNRTQQNERTETDILMDNFANNYVMSNTASLSIRNGIMCLGSGHGTTQPITFYCNYDENGAYDEPTDGQNIPCNYLNWEDGLAYLDWAGLRPITELEFEKACRGNGYPSSDDFAWGNNVPTKTSSAIINPGETNERVSNSGNALSNYDHDFDSYGPLRCGFAASSSTSRAQAGASYYGLMEMSGNLSERCITVGTPEGRAYTNLNGDGELSGLGEADVSFWPDANGQSVRGGNFRRESARMMVSNRAFAAYNMSLRYDNAGWRGVRSLD